MDVWFDSGSSWAGVANGRGNLGYPAGMFKLLKLRVCDFDCCS
jgi:isoleucyl-tRNA synthetase